MCFRRWVVLFSGGSFIIGIVQRELLFQHNFDFMVFFWDVLIGICWVENTKRGGVGTLLKHASDTAGTGCGSGQGLISGPKKLELQEDPTNFGVSW